jgi:hypothetical protein
MATLQDIHDAYGELHAALKNAYWAASTIEDKDRIRGLEDVVFDVLTVLNQQDIQSRTEQYRALQSTIKFVNSKLQRLSEDIDHIIHKVDVASSITNAVAKVASIAAQL